jgi:hypothetical protein
VQGAAGEYISNCVDVVEEAKEKEEQLPCLFLTETSPLAGGSGP